MEAGNLLIIKIVDEMCIISYFILTRRITQNTVPNTDKFIQEMPCGQKLHNFSTKGLNQKKALLQIFKAWLCYPYNLPIFVH